jgi:hypothetical protein
VPGHAANPFQHHPRVSLGHDDPSDFFPPLGFLSWVTGAGAIAAGWPTRTARYWIAASVAMIVCEGLFSMLFFWPRNTIMFVEGSAVHSVEVLRQTAREFQSLHWGRVAFNAASAAFIFVGFLKFYRANLITMAQQAGPAAGRTTSPDSSQPGNSSPSSTTLSRTPSRRAVVSVAGNS